MSNLEELQLLNALVNDALLFLSRADRGDRAGGTGRGRAQGSEADKAIRCCDALLQEAGVVAERSGDAASGAPAPLVLRALVNLLTNAIRHSRSRRHDSGAHRAGPRSLGIALSVASAPGLEIPAPVRAQMFDRFYRARLLALTRASGPRAWDWPSSRPSHGCTAGLSSSNASARPIASD
jgi:two-component system heavy metal sensor histidine kinase CusS